MDGGWTHDGRGDGRREAVTSGNFKSAGGLNRIRTAGNSKLGQRLGIRTLRGGLFGLLFWPGMAAVPLRPIRLFGISRPPDTSFPQALIKHQRYAHAHQFKRANRSLRKAQDLSRPCHPRHRAANAQNPDCAQPTRPAQIRLKLGSSRPTESNLRVSRRGALMAITPGRIADGNRFPF
jgi:hypothetical protein